MITQAQLKELLHYDPDTGVFTYRVNRGGQCRGNCAGYLTSQGYIMIQIAHRAYKAHRLVFLYMVGSFPINDTDHINGIKSDNRWSNLRDVTASVNVHNRSKPPTNNNTGVTGVSWSEHHRRWNVRIMVKKRRLSLGYFKNFDDAVKARKDAEIRFGVTPTASTVQNKFQRSA